VTGLLSDVIVIDLTRALAGPHAAMMLGDLGAHVIKVETPDSGDDSRGWGPPFVGPAEEPVSTYFMSCNRNKLSVTADLKSAEGRDLLRRMVRQADVLLENFRPGVLDRLAQGEAGLMSLTGPSEDQPTKVGLPMGDLLAGMYAAYGVLAALHERVTTGQGRVVRTSLLAAIVGTHAYQGTRWTVGADVPVAMGNAHPSIAPYGLFATATAPIQVACGSEGLWRAFAPLVGLDATDARFASNTLRVRRRDELSALIEGAFSTASAEHWLVVLAGAGVPAGKVRRLDDVYAWDQTRSQGLVVKVDHPSVGPVELPGPPLRFDDLPYAGGRSEHLPPPRLGEHNADVEAWLSERERTA
jgi:crotonobetainyl-CoA:carnitine CoA-transferase CaiB-like acyl-CoA transferase